MNESLSEKVRAIENSVTLEVSALAAELKAQGHAVIAFAAGEPDLPVPENVQEAAIQAIRDDKGKYTASAGMGKLRESLAAKWSADGFAYEPKNCMVSSGAKSSLFLALYALLNKGDEVIFPAPFWGSYTEMVKAAEGRPRILETKASEDFQPDPDALRALINDRTRILLLNSPNNPTGTVYSRETLEAIAEVVRENPRLFVLSDDIYEHLIYTGESFTNLLHVAPDLIKQTILINGLSKSHSMTGWRMGFAGGPPEVIAAMARAQSQMAGSPCTITQVAALTALGSPPAPERRESLDRRRKFLIEEVRSIPDLEFAVPRGAFYLFPSIAPWLGRRHGGTLIQTSTEFAKKLLEDELVATVAGDAFGAPSHLRLTYTVTRDTLSQGVARIKHFLDGFD